MANKLQRFHRYALSRTVWPLSVGVGLLMALAWQLAPESTLTKILSPLTSAAAVGGMFFFVERTIRLKLWRIAYPELDFAGTWSGGTQYNEQQFGKVDDASDFEPFSKTHDIRFRQDCLNVAVDYDETEDFHGWNSTVATLASDDGRVSLRYAYEVTYRQGELRDDRLPPRSRGLEEVSVVDSREGRRPGRITGTFAHVVDGPRPLYSGTVAFEREVEEPEPTWRRRLLEFIVTKWLKPPTEN